MEAKYCRRCGEKFEDIPEITDFKIVPTCRIGDMLKLSWNVTNAETVTLNENDVTGKKDVSVRVRGDEDLTLVARKGKNKIEKTITIHPQKLQIHKEPKPNPTPSVSVLKRKKWTVLFGLLALATLLVVLIDETMIPSYFNIGYSGWQDMKPIIIVLCCVILVFGIGSIIYSKIKNISK